MNDIYKGMKLDTYVTKKIIKTRPDGSEYSCYEKIKVISQDTRELEPEKEKLKGELKLLFNRKYLDLYPQYKWDQARTNTMDDKKEQAELLELDKQFKKEYELRKQAIENATTCDEAHEACHYPKKVVEKKNLLTLGLTSTYILEDDNV